MPFDWIETNAEVIEAISAGITLPKPSICDDEVFQIMKR